jgi:hypothetical protein
MPMAQIPKQLHLRVAGSCKMKFRLVRVFCPSPCIFYSLTLALGLVLSNDFFSNQKKKKCPVF